MTPSMFCTHAYRSTSCLHRWRWVGSLVVGLGTIQSAVRAQEKITFQDHVRPIFEAACNNCHNPDKKKGGLDLTSYAAMMGGGSSGEIVASGAPTDSRLYASVTRAAEPYMPPQGDPLSAAQLDVIKKWIEGGLLDTPGGVARKARKPAFSAQIAGVKIGKPDGPPPMPENLLLEPVVATARASATAALASSPWAPLIAISGQRQVLLYNTDTLELAGVLPLAEGAVQSLTFSRNGQLVVAGTGRGGKSGRVVGWEVKTGKKAFEIGDERDTVLAADLSADQEIVALGSPSRRIKLFKTATGELVKDIKKHTDWVTALQFSPDGVLLATGDRAGNLYVWEGKSGNEYFTLSGHTAAITAVSWRDDGNVVASASEDGTIRLWEMNEGKEVKKWSAHGGGVRSMSFTHDGRLVSCGRDTTAKVWNQEGAQQVAQNQFSDLTLAACFSHDGQRFVVGDWSGRISVWNTADAKPAGDMSAAPPTIDSRLASLAPEIAKTTQAVTTAKDTVGSMTNNLAAAQDQMEQARKSVAKFQDQSGRLEKSLTDARGAAEVLLARLGAPAPQPVPPPPAALDLSAAKALAEDWRQITASANAALGPIRAGVGDQAKAFATVPSQLSAQLTLARAKETEMKDYQKKAAEAQATLDAAAAALEQQTKAASRWEAAKVNALVINKRDELSTLTAKLEDLTAALAEKEKAPADPQAGLDGLRTEKTELEAAVAALQHSIEAETTKYLSMLPK